MIAKNKATSEYELDINSMRQEAIRLVMECFPHGEVSIRMIFSGLKAQLNSAQGNALGRATTHLLRPVRAAKKNS